MYVWRFLFCDAEPKKSFPNGTKTYFIILELEYQYLCEHGVFSRHLPDFEIKNADHVHVLQY